jgi:putative flippase GtrA
MSDLLFGIVSRKTAKQLFLYGVLGISRNAVGYLVYLLITYLGVPPKIAMTILYSVGTTVGFFGYRKLIFAHQGCMLRAGLRYLIAHLMGYSINLVILIIMVDKLGYAHQWVQILAIFVVAGFLFLTFKIFVFGDVEPLKKEEG